MPQKSHDDFADRVKCPVCGSTFEDGRYAHTNPENQAHFKALEHHAEEHPDQKWRGVTPIYEE